MSDTPTADLVQQGLTAARVGDIDDARRLLTEATQQMPYNVEAWLALSGVVESLMKKRECFKRVLELEPTNQEAKAGLALVEHKLNEAESQSQPSDDEDISVRGGETGLGFCYRHPNIETGLRCNRCNKPICPKCAHRTPVGFRCPDCIREHEDKYYSGGTSDYVIAAVVAFPLSLIAASLFFFILGGFGFFVWIIAFFLAPAVAGFIAEAVRWAVKKRRSRYLGRVGAACLILGTLPFVLLGLFFSGNFITPAIFLFLGTTTILARLR